MFPLASFLLSFFGLFIATLTDFRDRTIPDWVPLLLGLSGLGLAAYESWLLHSGTPLFWSAAVIVGTFGSAYAFWKAGAWAGGDVKLFTGLSALNPFNPLALSFFFNFSWAGEGKKILVASHWPFFMLNYLLPNKIFNSSVKDFTKLRFC